MSDLQSMLKKLGREQWEDRIVDDVDCWLWIGGRDRFGYGRVRYGTRMCRIHRIFYEASGESLIEGHSVHHSCGRKNCVNPAHLEQLSPSEHIKRHEYNGFKTAWEERRARTHCGRGHELTPENIRIRTSGDWVRRVCLTCERVRRLVDQLPPVTAAEQLTVYDY